ncbi:hypothetical protein [Companilactobacillus sp.]|jgi:hypothetical protein|uniref:hypothetical protein n=1 Tax=Companilactobacillus sp. TaxID=2767905 RepID=UPI0025C5F03F|nr:hypothetical protein [Companilactobacillus sp.]MCH4008527.1 hypothetical protein [Companilactobacillus sp.]MCH4051294.1 hypothetical protein [Companilactobacillus sp.]MCH4076470.1 hypothetical protein [Companilactobacillus sp.]MCH4125045.1 hypothetical protein [Companilactobacillus sp.]MCH4131586.1 hypothetical protein [Companilactobacillus sp.]
MNATDNELVHAFKTYWDGHSNPPTGQLQNYISQWRMFHLQKAILFLILTVALIWVSWFIWKKYFIRRKPLSSKGKAFSILEIFTSLGAFLTWIIVVANIQGLINPYSSLMTKIIPAADSATKSIFKTMKPQIHTGDMNGKTAYLLHDFTTYHLDIAILGLITLFILLWIVIYLFRFVRNNTLPTLQQIVTLTMLAIFTLLLLTDLLITIANFGTFFEPDYALIDALSGNF